MAELRVGLTPWARGRSSRDEVVRIDGISDEALRARLGLSTSA